MPPRFSYWTILAGGLPTSFRAAEREDLLPTLRRLQERHPDAEMKWFQRGKLWASPEEAESAFVKPAEPRGRDWRPGGQHRDPREPFKKQKRERNQARRQQRFDRKQGGQAQGSNERPAWKDRQGRPPERRPGTDRPRSGGGHSSMSGRPASGDRRPPSGDRRPPSGDRRPPSSDRRPPSGERRPPSSDRRPPSGDRRPPSSDRRPPSSDRRPPSSDRRPPSSDRRPPSSDRRPPSSDRRPGPRPPSKGGWRR